MLGRPVETRSGNQFENGKAGSTSPALLFCPHIQGPTGVCLKERSGGRSRFNFARDHPLPKRTTGCIIASTKAGPARIVMQQVLASPNEEQSSPVTQTSNPVPTNGNSGSKTYDRRRWLAITGLIWPCGEICGVEPNYSLGKDGLCQQTGVPEFARRVARVSGSRSCPFGLRRLRCCVFASRANLGIR
jgi:hypothetical protein